MATIHRLPRRHAPSGHDGSGRSGGPGGGDGDRGHDDGDRGDDDGVRGRSDSDPPGEHRGRGARTPREIPKRGWRDVLLRTKDEIAADNLSLIAAGVAFYALLALPSALGAMVALWGMVADPQDVQRQLVEVSQALPADAASLVEEQLTTVASGSDQTLGWAALAGFLLLIWSARKAVTALMDALNVVYEERERRGFLKRALVSLGLTLAAIVAGVVAFALVAGVPAVLAFVGLDRGVELLVQVVRWVLLLGLVLGGLAVLYRYGPSRRAPRWHWVSWGAGFATLAWLVAAGGFSLFVANFGKYGETYGALAGVVVLLLWFWISAYVALAGAELNAEMEHQTRVDTTTGPDKPLGSRDATMADTVGEPR